MKNELLWLVTCHLVIGIVSGSYDNWSKKLPEYCMELPEMDKQKIQPLSLKDTKKSNYKITLQQTQVVARHGSRAPYYRVFCWDAVKSPLDVVWNCSTDAVWSQNIRPDGSPGYGRLYRKEYLNGQNILTGTCPVGGLLPLGLQQHAKNGQLLRDAYIGKGPFKLFDSNDLEVIPQHQIYLRSDDQERTLGSGHALVDSLFAQDNEYPWKIQSMLTWKTADEKTDHVNTNAAICPILNLISNESAYSERSRSYSDSSSALQIESSFQEIVGNFSWNTVLECLMIARCNSIPLPKSVTPELFDDVIHSVETRQRLMLTYQESRFAKTAMSPLMHEILKKSDLAVKKPHKAPKMAITIGHDSTIMPLLAAILGESWDGKWTPYAGMLIFELYSLEDKNGHDDTKHAIRLVFKGKPLFIPKCDDILCDYELFKKLNAFGWESRNCTLPDTAELALSSIESESSEGRRMRWLHPVVIVVFGGAAVVFALSMLFARSGKNEELRSLLG